MKTVVLYAVCLANENPGTPGYKILPVDPDPGVPASKRTPGSGYALPVPVTMPDRAHVSETKYEETFVWLGETPLNFHWEERKGIMLAWPATWGTKQPLTKDCWIFSAVTLDSLLKILPLA